MATTTNKTKRFTCDKQARTFICEDNLQNFCHINLTEHFRSLNIKYICNYKRIAQKYPR